MTKYKPILQERIVKERKQEEEQKTLRKKYGISDKKTVLIKKEHLFTAVTKTLGKIFQKCLVVLLIVLAFNGVVALVHPDSRVALTYVYVDALDQLETLCPPVEPVVKNIAK